MNVHCDNLRCDNNTGFYQCMYGVNNKLIKHIKDNKPVCNHLKNEVLQLEVEFTKVNSY